MNSMNFTKGYSKFSNPLLNRITKTEEILLPSY